jgi:hypothetical protein
MIDEDEDDDDEEEDGGGGGGGGGDLRKEFKHNETIQFTSHCRIFVFLSAV